MKSLEDQIILITGAGSGLGLELARQLSPYNPKLLLLSDQGSELAAAAAELKPAATYVCDISELEQVNDTIKQVEAKFGHIDILVNNAGIWIDNEIEERDPERSAKGFLTNSLGPIRVTTAALPLVRKSKRPQIINVISTGGASDTEAGNNELWMTYGATKWALNGYTRALTRKLRPEGIKVTGFFPGGFESLLYEKADRAEGVHGEPWMMRTEDVAEALVFAMTRPKDVLVERMLLTKMKPAES